MQTDNQQVAELGSGLSRLTEDTLRPTFIRIAQMLFKLLCVGYRPRQDIQPLIEWDPWVYNAVADHAANCALDEMKDWKLQWIPLEELPLNSQLRLCVDGAQRGSGQAAGGLALFAYTIEGGLRYTGVHGRRVLRSAGNSICFRGFGHGMGPRNVHRNSL